MTTNATIKLQIQKLMPGQLVELYTLDLSPIGQATTYNFCNGTMDDGAMVAFGGVDYTPLPVEAEGWEQTGEGKLPRPRIRISNITGVLQASVIANNDLVGCELTRRRTFYQYLDGGSSPDSSAYFPDDVYIVDRKTKQSKLIIEWELVASLDIENIQIPRKQALGTCTHRYRNYVGSAFVYTDVTCPYTTATYFKDTGASTALPAEDNCGRRIRDCKLRFGATAILPFEGFPNIKRFIKGR
jgi:lambda family phage minor tail protein L